MTYTFRPAIREGTSTLTAFAGGTGSGKTMSAIRYARGLVGAGGKLALIDAEAGRALHYAEMFSFDHCELNAPYTPEAYLEAIVAAEQAGYPAIITDSWSHEWNGDGGLLDMHEAELTRLATNKETGELDAWRLEAMNAPAWKKPKIRHKKMMSRLTHVRAHLVFCLRAEPKIKFVKDKNERGKEVTKIVSVGWQPIAEKLFMYEMTASFMMTEERPGMPQPIKLQDQHKHCFPLDQHVSERSGELMAAWARGRAAQAKATNGAADAGGTEIYFVNPDGTKRTFGSVDQWRAFWNAAIKERPLATINLAEDRNREALQQVRSAHPDAALEIVTAIEQKRRAEQATL